MLEILRGITFENEMHILRRFLLFKYRNQICVKCHFFLTENMVNAFICLNSCAFTFTNPITLPLIYKPG